MKKELVDLIEKSRKKEVKKVLESQVKLLTKELEDKDRLLEFYEGFDGKEIKPITSRLSKSKGEGTVVALSSDVHAEHKITREETNGINEYSPDICARRLENYFINLVRLTENNRRDIALNDLVLGILGDLPHGFIHDEYIRSNYLTPPEAALFIIEQYRRGLRYLIDNGNFKRIIVVCKVGNHSRITDKIYSSDEALHSYEWAIYNLLKKEFTEIEWMIENSYFSYLNVYDKVIRFHHGHAFKYAGGIGGLYVPLVRYVTKINKGKLQKADLDCIGHWHSLDYLRAASVLINGSVCGYDSYAQRKGFEPEPPAQQFLIVDKKRGFTINAPIMLN